MSFSSEVKQELSKISNLANKEMVKYELKRRKLGTNFRGSYSNSLERIKYEYYNKES